jgi:hypothetical protein
MEQEVLGGYGECKDPSESDVYACPFSLEASWFEVFDALR